MDNTNLLEWEVDLAIPRFGKYYQFKQLIPVQSRRRGRTLEPTSAPAVQNSHNPASAYVDTNLTSGLAKSESCHAPFCSPNAVSEPDLGPPVDPAQSGKALEAVVCPPEAVGYSLEQSVRWDGRRSRIRKNIQRGLDYSHQLAVGLVDNVSALAAKEGLTPNRVNQLLRFTQLAPEILGDLFDPTRSGPFPTANQLKDILRRKSHKLQVARFVLYIKRECSLEPAESPRTKPHTYRTGFAHLFERARRFRDMCQSGQYGSLRAVGNEEGVSGDRVCQLLSLLNLAPDIIARLDVPAELRPPGIVWDDLRRISLIRNQEEQRRTFERILKESRPGGDEMEQLKS